MNTVSKARGWLPGEADALEARFGLRATALLTSGSNALPHDVSERLRVARQQAVSIAAKRIGVRPVVVAGGESRVLALATAGGARVHGSDRSDSPWWSWMATAVPVLVLLAGLLGIEHWQQVQQISTAADIDVALLGDNLPPSAFTDPGFAEFLKEPANDVLPPQ